MDQAKIEFFDKNEFNFINFQDWVVLKKKLYTTFATKKEESRKKVVFYKSNL